MSLTHYTWASPITLHMSLDNHITQEPYTWHMSLANHSTHEPYTLHMSLANHITHEPRQSHYTWVSGARFLTGDVLECHISRRRSVAVLCMLYNIRCNPVHPLNGALPGQYVPARVTRGALVAHRYTYAPPRCRTLQYNRTFIPFSVSLWNDLAHPVFDGVGLAGFKSRANTSLLA